MSHIYLLTDNSGRQKNSLPVKIQGDSYSFNVAESKYDDQISLSHTNVKEKGLNTKTMFVIQKYHIGLVLHYTVSNHEQCLCVWYPNYTTFHH